MNLLIITNNPQRASFRYRIGIYLPILREQGINCHVAKLPSGIFARLKLLNSAGNFDGVFLHKKILNFFDGFRLPRLKKKLIYDFDDAVMYSPNNPERDSSSHLGRFKRTIEMADMVIAGNSYLAEHAHKLNPNVEILPTGLDTDAYEKDYTRQGDGKIRLVWIGSGSTIEYLVQIRDALEEIGSRFNNVILRIICDQFVHLRNIGIEQCTWSQQSQVKDLVTSDIGLAPLPDNRFTKGKCGFKILQYAAASLPVIASPVGVNAEYVQEGINGFLAESTSDWVEKISLLVEDLELRKKMGRASRNEVGQFDVKVLAARLTDIIRKCLTDSNI